MSFVTVAVVQDAAVAFDKGATLERVEQLLARAAESSPDLVLFPEAFLGGYPSGMDWGGPGAGIRSDESQSDFLRYTQGAIEVPGPECTILGEMARAHNVNLIMGIIERRGGTLSCSVLHFNRVGDLVHVRRKLMPTMAERMVWGQSDGSSLSAVEFDFGRTASVICWENYMPLLRQAMYAQDISIYCAPTADDQEPWVSSMRHIAQEGRCFVLSACQFSRRADFPANYGWFPSDNPDFIVSRGGSCIVDPLGGFVCEPVYDKSAILTAKLDMDLVVRGRHTFDVVGHYARPDIFQLSVDRRKRSLVAFENEPAKPGSAASVERSPIMAKAR